jgi:hypothetical protein
VLAVVVMNIGSSGSAAGNIHKHEWKLNVASHDRVWCRPCLADLLSVKLRLRTRDSYYQIWRMRLWHG